VLLHFIGSFIGGGRHINILIQSGGDIACKPDAGLAGSIGLYQQTIDGFDIGRGSAVADDAC